MTLHLPALSAAVDRGLARPLKSMDQMEKSFRNCDPGRGALTADGWLARRVNRALWKAFPAATSDNALAELAQPYFRNPTTGDPIETRTIRLWLRGVSTPRGEHLLTLMWMVGPDFFRLDRREAR